ncbi:TauD/TfdA family dioxygenase [Limibaculum sp. M0105]|uniref:TauD/TfdA family dioxygenase n=1 Tax=Thermohalobaculum xanthum TaxID=2753746 RepID=A0A8J7M7E5_9RHOB|nr:TauD/TfdA family dioxygenase [Thermohalobaculum xanthum]MBK0399949.1 TauD/TfdA family dioxygenase [Thermohalobaculum xanthum]
MLRELPVTGTIGAEIEGVDLKQPISGDLAQSLRAALARHQVIFFRGQSLDIAAQKRLTAAFGPPMTLPYVKPVEGEPEVIRVLKEADEGGGVFGGDWHADFSFLERPPAGSILSGEVIPPFGGDTVWAGQAAAWEALPEALKTLLRGRDAIHVGKPYGVRWAPPAETRTGRSIEMSRGDPSADQERRHPAVIVNPVTGREALFLNPLYVSHLDGLSEEESRPLLAQVQAHTIRPEFCVRFRWSPGAVAVWDNLFTQHYAVNDYHGHRRLMWRTTFAGPDPRDLAS